MSNENVEIVRRGYERFNEGDIEGFLELCDPELEFRDLPDLPGSGVFVGHDALRGWWAQLYDAFDELRFDADEFIDAGDRVLVPTHGTGRGKSSGALVEMHFSNVWTLSDGKLTRCISYSDHAEALEAAGLRE
jgi:ketosteroid isomerase-like protein